MARAALQRGLALGWRPAELVSARAETAVARTLTLRVPGWEGHEAGQHVDLRLTAEDGYTAQRSYSLSAPADGEHLQVTVQLVEDGEVSPYLVDDIAVGDRVEVLGPLGGWFVWRRDQVEPVLLVGGGSGVAPLMAMRRAHAAAGSPAPMRLLYSARSPDAVLFADELGAAPPDEVTVLYTRTAPPGHPRPPRRLDEADLASYAWEAGRQPTCYVCGPTPFVEVVTGLLTEAGVDPARIRAERFGPTGA